MCPHSNPHVWTGKTPKPTLLEVFPSLEVETKEYVSLILIFTVEILGNELLTEII